MTKKLQTDLITVTRLGHTFKASRRTVAWLDYVIHDFKIALPKARLVMLQACYNTDVEASAGTHDYDAAFDFTWTGTIPGLTKRKKWLRFQRFFRNHQAAAWWRHTGTWSKERVWHVHGFPLPKGLKKFDTVVGQYIDGGDSLRAAGRRTTYATSQLKDYMRKAFGLAGQHAPGSDTSWRPERIRAFNYAAWTKVHGVPLGRGEK